MRKSWIPALITLVAFTLGGTAAGVAPASAASDTPLRVMPLGDSITWGVGSSAGNGYRGPLWNRLAADGHPLDFVGTVRNGSMSDPDNQGHSGYRIDQIAALADASLTRYRPNVVTLHIGTNDLQGASEVDSAIARLRSLVNQITADVPDATVLVASLVVSTSSSEERWRGTYNQATRHIVSDAQAAGKRVAFVDMSSLTTADLADPLHPNDSGYQKMADAFHRGVQSADSAGWLKNPAPAPARVHSGIAGKCMDVNGASTADGTAVQTWSCGDGANQYWSAYTDGTLRSLGKCLDAAGGATANGTKVQIWACHGGANQVWQPYNGGYRNPASGRCLDVPGSSTADGTQLVLWDCNGGSNQKWTTLTTG
ncbi:ricin-type beta-trefoil lectin domain protein [Streptomyces sp. ISL-22]|uniref:ricin-type beta-trefoil lectin domain protein n=1 Tax=unclassified Streptomyces TaxID=2593676 RepID=UPI001BE67729|nr:MULTISPECIES: ricin-type beta-trefoil lectin domain protein [unclassified Streptomyces]MBT2421812.1 ricin-type beta-trefoil lectin domain protein [Streptomyces sp. ISL-24]MBT2432670.1 ricin-type beta-trefoil lectin domain protein [Streptomyces sp. ISL-22]